MNETVATEAQLKEDETSPAAPAHPPEALPLETISGNARMRHIPTIEWMIRKLETTLHERIELVISSVQRNEADETLRQQIDRAFHTLGRSFEKVGEVARPGGRNHHGDWSDPVAHVRSSLVAAVSALRSVDPDTFGRREPFHHFDRSRAEMLYGTVLSTITHVETLVTLVRQIDPGIDEKLYAHLVNLSQPLNDEVKRPIA